MAMTMVSAGSVTGGVDTHLDVHVAAALDRIGGLVDLAGLAGQRSTQDEVDAELARIPFVPCLFMFQLIVETDGKSAQEYVVHLGSWGALTMSEANLRKPGSVQLSVGLR